MSARDAVLGRVRAALADRPEPPTVPRDYRREDDVEDPVALFAERVRDYAATVVVTDAAAGAVADACAAFAHVLVPPGLPQAWRPAGAEEDDGRPGRELDAIDAAVTGCAVAIAETGTFVLDGGERSGRRALTLVPDHHVCVVEASQIVGIVPQALARLDPRRPITLVSGPSASSDIELQRVEGVHGPRHLTVVIVEGA